METYVWKHTKAGGLVRLFFTPDSEPKTLDQASLLIPPGAYTTFRTYQKAYALHFSSHLDRLEETARITGHAIQIDRPFLRENLRSAIEFTPWNECRVRIVIDLEADGSEYFLLLEELSVPSSDQYRSGVHLAVVRSRRENPKAKTTSFIPAAGEIRKYSGGKAYEYLLAGEHGELLEGLSSNFFAVRKRRIHTAGEGVLEGITRKFTLEIIRTLGLSLSLEPVSADEIVTLDEAFITSSSRGILPAVNIDGTQIGNGRPGKITHALSKEFSARISENLELI